jgi:hypothetical protein
MYVYYHILGYKGLEQIIYFAHNDKANSLPSQLILFDSTFVVYTTEL